MSSAIQMVVSVFVPTDCVEQEAEVVFHTSYRTFVSRLLKMKTRRRIFDQRPIQIILSIFRSCQSPQNQSVLDVKTSLESVIITSLDDGRCLVIEAQGLLKPTRSFFDNSSANQKYCF